MRMTATGDRGFSLIAILLLVVVLASLAVAGMGAGVMQERMAGNARDRNLALQAAEAALRALEEAAAPTDRLLFAALWELLRAALAEARGA